MSKASISERYKIIENLREYQEHGTTVTSGNLTISNIYRWDDIFAIIFGTGYCLTTYEMIDRLIDLIEPW